MSNCVRHCLISTYKTLWVLVLLLLVWAIVSVSPRVSGGPSSSNRSDSCRECHTQQWRQWQQSRHAVSGSDGLFLHEYQLKPAPWCLKCHAPAASRGQSVRQAMHAGVDCLTCHQPNQRIVARSKAVLSPHNTQIDPSFGSPDQCGQCHEFKFPRLDVAGRWLGDTTEPLQKTVSEFRASPARKSGLECISCHMGAKAGHGFPAAFSDLMIKRALKVSLCATNSHVVLHVKNNMSAHNLPTGGVHRAIEISIWATAFPERGRSVRLHRLVKGSVGVRKVYRDTTLAALQARSWRVRRKSLSLYGIKTVELTARYLYGTHPNPRSPYLTRDLVRRTMAIGDIRKCGAEIAPVTRP